MRQDGSTETLYVCVDDTDDLTKETSTGSISEEIANEIEHRYGSRLRAGITRHQLLLAKDVPYTSHNSSMCFDVVVPRGKAEEVADLAWECIEARRAATSNPGLCIWVAPSNSADVRSADGRRLVEFGMEAKRRYVSVDEAKALADSVSGLILRGGGETAQGMVGALAGVGLRFGGEDGRFRGKWDLADIAEGAQSEGDRWATVAQCIEGFAGRGIDARFVDASGAPLASDDEVVLIPDAKPVLRGGDFTVVSEPGADGAWLPCTKKSFAKKVHRSKVGCELFERDPDAEEHVEDESRRSCGACLYRIFSEGGISCSKKVFL